MSRSISIHAGVAIIAEIPGYGIVRAQGTSVPSDGSVGYAKGCLFTNTAGSSLDELLYVNNGTQTSSAFVSANLTTS